MHHHHRPITPFFDNGSTTLLTVGGAASQAPTRNAPDSTTRSQYRIVCVGAAVGTLVNLYGNISETGEAVDAGPGVPGNTFPLLTGEALDVLLPAGFWFSIDSADADAQVFITPA